MSGLKRERRNGIRYSLKEILEAYETLVDKTKRRRYDSTLEFNDFVPKSFNTEKENFFEVFSPYIRINSYWSKKSPVPQLGEKDDLKQTLKFYEFWFKFESWRDFHHKDQYDVEEAENRWEKRYMERENKKMKSDLLKKEKKRIKKLVSLCYEFDPRIL